MKSIRLSHFFAIGAAALTLGCSQQTIDRLEITGATPVGDILAAMTLEEKIGQVIQADIASVTPDEARDYHLGSVLNGGNSAPGGAVVAPPEEWIALADAYWRASTDRSDGGLGIPLLWGTDAVHGHNNLQNATIFPHNSGLGATGNPDLIRQIGEVTAREVRATGIDWTFAPTLAVARDDRWGRAYESYSEDPAIVERYATAMVEGLQGTPGEEGFLTGDHVIATAKHFVADGGTHLGIDRGDAKGDPDEIFEIHGAGYGPAIDAEVQTVMASFSSINGEKMHGSKRYLTDILRGDLGFQGFVVGDWNGHGEVPGCTPEDCLQALDAGVDMYMAPDSWKGLYNSLLDHAKSGRLDMARLDEAVTRILRVKKASGLFDAGLPSSRSSAQPELLGTDVHRAVARQAVRESLVLLKNANSLLPIRATSTVMVTGSGGDSMQQQTGGWTLSWQGDSNANDAFETGQTLFSGIADALSGLGGSAFYSADGSYETKPDVAVVVYGEQPYAEYRGDRSDLVFEFDDGENLALIRSLKDAGIPVVSVFLTGRPLWVNPHLNASDAFVVAWLPGTEGGGVADVIVANGAGDPRHDFSGKLAFSWPMDGTGEPINAADDVGVLYPFGYGLSYGQPAGFSPLSEAPGVDRLGSDFDGMVVQRGDAVAPFVLSLGDNSHGNTPVTSLMGSSLSGAVSVRGTDYRAQEDSRTITFSGNGPATASIRTDRPIDLAIIDEPQTLALTVTWRLDETPKGPLYIAMGCGEGCSGELNLLDHDEGSQVGEWHELRVPVACFVEAGLIANQVQSALAFRSQDKASLSLHTAQIVSAGQPLTCTR